MRFPCIHDFKPRVCLPCPLESLLENRDDDLDCAPRDVWVTPFTPVLMKRYIDCWSAHAVKGGERYRRVWNSPCASKQILILYLHLHQITQPKTWTVELHNSYQECTLGWVSWCRYQPMISWGRTLALTWLHPGIPNDVRRLGAWCLALFSDSLVIMAIVVGSK